MVSLSERREQILTCIDAVALVFVNERRSEDIGLLMVIQCEAVLNMRHFDVLSHDTTNEGGGGYE